MRLVLKRKAMKLEEFERKEKEEEDKYLIELHVKFEEIKNQGFEEINEEAFED